MSTTRADASDTRWVSCSQDADWSTSIYRHLVWRGGDTTFCGATGMPADVWRGNSTKDRCPSCAARAKA